MTHFWDCQPSKQAHAQDASSCFHPQLKFSRAMVQHSSKPQRNMPGSSCTCSGIVLWTTTLFAASAVSPTFAWTSSPSPSSHQSITNTNLFYTSNIQYKPTESGWLPSSQILPKKEESHPFDACQQWQSDFLHSNNIHNLQPLSVTSRQGNDMSYRTADDGTTSLHTKCWSSEDYRLIRMTDFTSKKAHVVSSMLYPKSSLLPVLGMEMIQIGPKLHICAADFQPISDDDDDTSWPALTAIRNDYPPLHGQPRDDRMGAMFSDHLLLATSREGPAVVEDMIRTTFLPAIQRYQQLHTTLVAEVTGSVDTSVVLEHHARFDTVAARLDKSKPMLSQAFGEEWALEYVHDIMFPLAER